MSSGRINGVELYWELTGDAGEPLVFVHGSWADHRAWDRLVPSLSRSFRVLTYDRRGHSRSERPAGQGSINEDVADLCGLLEYLGLAPANLAASSFGGAIALRAVAERPDIFRRLVVHEPPLFDLLEGDDAARAALDEVREHMAAAAALLAGGAMEAGTRHFVETIAAGPGGWERIPPDMRQSYVFNAPTWLDETRDPGALAVDLSTLRRFPGPVRLTVGEKSPSFFRPVVDVIARNLTQADVHTFAGAGHAPHISHSGQYLEALTTFIRVLRGPRTDR
ncbi:MAG TPA: alpha/beta hydrolase [Gemmatimonadaceae bacterium]|nr:alpha/beta hydrolase [Gemmatimonadaceae bacterium]